MKKSIRKTRYDLIILSGVISSMAKLNGLELSLFRKRNMDILKPEIQKFNEEIKLDESQFKRIGMSISGLSVNLSPDEIEKKEFLEREEDIDLCQIKKSDLPSDINAGLFEIIWDLIDIDECE